jgi:hypothetical protein
MFDLRGVKVREGQFSEGLNRIDLSWLSSGVYFIRAGAGVYKVIICREGE